MKRCEQTKCSYYLNGGCKACSKCGFEPYKINTECQSCYDCENEEDALRWKDDNKMKQEQIVAEIRKEIEEIKEMLPELENEIEVVRNGN
jgi:hypothetical protein